MVDNRDFEKHCSDDCILVLFSYSDLHVQDIRLSVMGGERECVCVPKMQGAVNLL